MDKQPIPSGQCPTCGSNDKRCRLCGDPARPEPGDMIKWRPHKACYAEAECTNHWHDQPTPAILGPNNILGITGGTTTPAAQPEREWKAWELGGRENKRPEPVSAEATKPEFGASRCDTGTTTDLYAWEANRPPVAPPEAEGAREWANQFRDIHELYYGYADGLREFVIEMCDRFAASKLAQKEAEISRLTADLATVRDLWEIVTDQGIVDQKAREAAEAANTELRTALRHVIADAEAWAQVTHYLVEGRETYIKWASLDAGKAALAKGE